MAVGIVGTLALGVLVVLLLPDPKETTLRCTPVELVGADQHGVFANAGIRAPMSPEAGQGHTVAYSIVHFRWQERSVSVVGELPRIFY